MQPIAQLKKFYILCQAIKKYQMTLTQKIKSNPYLKVSNCKDISDVDYAISELFKLDAEFGEKQKTLLNLWSKFLFKKAQLLKK